MAQSRGAAVRQAAVIARFQNGGNAVEIAADFIDHLLFVPVRVNQGQPSLFELDTTASASSIDPARAAELGLTRLSSAQMNLSGLDISFAQLASVPQAEFGARFGRPYQGTLGNDFLSAVVARIDYARQTMQLYDPTAYKYAGHGKSLRVTFVDGLPVVKAKAIVEGQSIDADFIVNTALAAPVLIFDHYAGARRISLRKSISAASMPLLQAENDALGRLDRFQLGPYSVEASLVVFSKQAPPAASDSKLAGEIGAEMLRRFGVVIDYSRQQILLDPNSEFNSEDFEDMSGLTVVAGGANLKQFMITDVRPSTPGAEAGLRKGDVIEGIDGDPAAELSLPDIHRLFRLLGPPHPLVITRNGKTFTVNLRMHRLL
ncbi:MAG: aspartyl protease family protein [Acidobacteriota bacterium]|nr:aspartyl protease family protein [Acidobacteriota bacterium]